MIILYRTTPSSFLKAAMLSLLYNGACIHADELCNRPPTDRDGDVIIDCDTQSLSHVRDRYKAVFGPTAWLDGKKARQLASATYYAARYKAEDRYSLIISVVRQALAKSPDYVLSRVSREARTMFNRARRVYTELHRAFGFVRLVPVTYRSAQILIGKAEFENDIADLVVRYFTRRHPGYTIYLLAGDSAFYLEDRALKAVPAASLPFSSPHDDFTEMWEAYYDSQFIESRKNPPLAKKHLPKKYWSWVPEGNKF